MEASCPFSFSCCICHEDFNSLTKLTLTVWNEISSPVPCFSIFIHANPVSSWVHAHSLSALLTARDGRIKIFGGDNIEGILISPKSVPYKFLQVWILTIFLLCQRQSYIYSVTALSNYPCSLLLTYNTHYHVQVAPFSLKQLNGLLLYSL